jgi:hypothetical protein
VLIAAKLGRLDREVEELERRVGVAGETEEPEATRVG